MDPESAVRPTGIDRRVAALTAPTMPRPPDAKVPATAGRVQRAAAELLDVLAELAAERALDASLPGLLAEYAEPAAENQNLAWSPEVGELIAHNAYLALAWARWRRAGSLNRSLLAWCFANETSTELARWTADAAHHLHATGDPGAYTPSEQPDPAVPPGPWA